MSKYLIGIDGGGSKTDFLLADMSLSEVCRYIDTRSNPSDIGIENTEALVVSGCEKLCENAGVSKSDIAAIFAGIAGLSTSDYAQKVKTALQNSFKGTKTGALHDGVNVLYGAFPDSDGVSIICGTGSSCFVKKGRELIRIGGYGSFDLTGNGYEIGKAAVAHALKTADGREKKGKLAELLGERLGNDFVGELPKLLPMTKNELATLAPLVFEACECGDLYAKEIIDTNIGYIAELIKRAGDFFEGGYGVSLAGGIWKSDYALELLKSKLGSRVLLTKSDNPPSFGAAAYAKQLLTENE